MPVRHVIKASNDHLVVTIKDIKDVARAMMCEVEEIPACFNELCETAEYNEFILYLINYFYWFFEKRAKENNPNPVHIEPSVAEKELYKKLCLEVMIAQKLLGRIYGALILGIGLCSQHHMACGGSRVSNTYKDRYMYEALYSYSTYAVWIALKRHEFDVIKNEVNRLLRTDTFNPVLRAQALQATQTDDDDTLSCENITPAEYRRKHSNQPPFMTVIHQRSGTLISILPLPKEEASWLYGRPTHSRDDSEEPHCDVRLNGEQLLLLDYDKTQLRNGIIGEPLSAFDPMTLTPLVVEDKDKNVSKHEIFSEVPLHQLAPTLAADSKVSSAISSAANSANSIESSVATVDENTAPAPETSGDAPAENEAAAAE